MREIAYSHQVKRLMEKNSVKQQIEQMIIRFSICDWGNITEDMRQLNIANTLHHRQVFGIYKLKNGDTIWLVKGVVEPDMILVLRPCEAYAYSAELPQVYRERV